MYSKHYFIRKYQAIIAWQHMMIQTQTKKRIIAAYMKRPVDNPKAEKLMRGILKW